MQKTNEQLQRDVLDELRSDPRLAPAAIGVAVVDGIVTLSGQLTTFAEKTAAVRAAERVPGVRGIAEELVVSIPGSLLYTDTDIAHAASDALTHHGDIPESVKVRVDHGWLWLEGSTEWPFQRAAAERVLREDMRALLGLRGVTNHIALARSA